ncbi:MAG: cell division protein FtsZ [Bacteroidota bacterium]|nr:cell division protein FtsZ [Bacteroidota bacterium]
MIENTNIGFALDLPKNQSNVIKVIGVGGGGSNAVTHMFKQGIKGVDFVICNTDVQALDNSPVPVKIQLGTSLTEGLGAGSNPEVGAEAAQESREELERILETNTKMVFITAGMGGGTGTGAAPIIAGLAKEKGILTVGIVTMPFQFEGKVRIEQAKEGIRLLRQNVDSLIVINNNKLREEFGNLTIKQGFSKADEVLSVASRSIAEVITKHYLQNIDLKDANTVLSNSGTAIMGSATAAGEDRARQAVIGALDSPLLNDNKITGAKNVLLLIVSGNEEATIDEMAMINDYIQEEAGHEANIIQGIGEDENLGDAISVTVIATGFNIDQQSDIVNIEPEKKIYNLEETGKQVIASKQNIAQEEVKQSKSVEQVATPVVNQPFQVYQADLIPTSELIKNIEVSFEIISAEALETVKSDSIAMKYEITEEKTPEVVFEVSSKTKDIQVNNPTRVVPITEETSEGIKKYALEEDVESESKHKVSMYTQSKEDEDDGIKLVVRNQEEVEQQHTTYNEDDEISVEDMSIDEALRLRAEKRKQNFKSFNHTFRNISSQQLEELEKEPAFRRQNIDLDKQQSLGQSRTSLSLDANNELQIRSNNSFLHDNVD